MACTKCGGLTMTTGNTLCTACTEGDAACVCPIQLSSECVLYQGENALLNIPAAIGDNLEDILIAIDTYLGLLTSGLFINIGTGAGTFKQVNVSSQAEFRSFVSADSSITITENATEIDIVVDAASVGENNTASNVGGGSEVFKVKTAVDLIFRTITGPGVSQLADTIAIAQSVYTGSNLGGGQIIFKQVTGTDFEFKTIVGTGGVTVSELSDLITISSTVITGSNLGGGSEVFKQITAGDIEHRTIIGGAGIDVTTISDTIEVKLTTVAEQIEKTGNVLLDDSYNNLVIMMDNGVANVTITVPTGLMADFKVGVIQLGTGTVSFAASGTTIQAAVGIQVEGQYFQAFCMKRNAGTEEYVALGNLV